MVAVAPILIQPRVSFVLQPCWVDRSISQTPSSVGSYSVQPPSNHRTSGSPSKAKMCVAAVEEPAVVADDQDASRVFANGFFERHMVFTSRSLLGSSSSRRLRVTQQSSQVHPVAFTTREHAHFFGLVVPVK